MWSAMAKIPHVCKGGEAASRVCRCDGDVPQENSELTPLWALEPFDDVGNCDTAATLPSFRQDLFFFSFLEQVEPHVKKISIPCQSGGR